MHEYYCKFHPEFIWIELNVNDDGNIRKMKYNPIHKHTLKFSLNACQNNVEWKRALMKLIYATCVVLLIFGRQK